ncbi:MAG: large conductance mechanosensitive channel protein MscL [Chloroflexota bacterium]
MLKEFMAFLTKSNALALAIGIIIGVALGAVVNSLVKDIIMPPIALVLGGIDFSSLRIVLKDTGDVKTDVAINYGAFILTLIQFVVISFVVFIIGKTLIKEKPEAPAEPSDEVKLLTEIRDSLAK